MFIILIAHIPWDPWALWIPARFGFSDATEIFVFCSGMASALAFGAVFRDRSWWMGAARIAYRVWQIFWAHVGVFLVVAMVVMMADRLIPEGNYVAKLNLVHFFERTEENLFGLLTLTYVPNFFDMLPMYIGILVMVPIVAGLAKIRKEFAFAFMGATWLLATFAGLNLPAEPWSDRVWFFNPFAWQLLFFTGFAFASGWLKAPHYDRRVVWLAIAIIVATVPFAWYKALNAVPELQAANAAITPLITKTDFGIFRYVHFLAIAYLAYWAVGEGGRRLNASGLPGRIVDTIRLVGQQSLAVFVSSLVLAQIFGVVLDQTGRDSLSVAAVNLFGFACLIAVAWVMRWYKSQPWRKQAVARGDARQLSPKYSGGGMPSAATAAPER